MPESEASLTPETVTPEPTAAEQPTREITRDGVHYVLLGTAHVSRASVTAVTEMAGSGDYDAIAVELCPARHQALTKQQQWKDMDLYRIIREKKAGLVMANLALGAYQRRIAEQFGIEPGAELKAAADAAIEHDIPLQLIDRDLATTLKRSYRAVPWYKRMMLTTGLVMSTVSSEEIDEEQIEKLKEGDILESTFTEFAEQSPELYEALIAERDRFMAARLRQENMDNAGKRILVVIGAGHLEGLAKYLAEDKKTPARDRKPVRTATTQPLAQICSLGDRSTGIDRFLDRFFTQPGTRMATGHTCGCYQWWSCGTRGTDCTGSSVNDIERHGRRPVNVTEPGRCSGHGHRPGRIVAAQTQSIRSRKIAR